LRVRSDDPPKNIKTDGVIAVNEHIPGDEQSKQVVCKEGVRVDQAATTACGDILIKTVLQDSRSFDFPLPDTPMT